MKRIIKYGVLPLLIFLSLFFATVVVLPVVLNVQKFLPEIEKKLSEVSGRQVSIGSNLGLSFFPWLSVSFSDLKIDNPQGYISDGFIKIESFEARIKLLPLLRKEVKISRFIIGGLEVNLEKKSDGEANWDFSRVNDEGKIITTPFTTLVQSCFPEDFDITLFAVTDGTVNWVDRAQHSHYKIEDLMLVLNNVTPNQPIPVDFKASIGGKAFAAEGQMGPLWKNGGQGALPVDFTVSLGNTLRGQVKGQILNLSKDPGYDLVLHVLPFSARELFASLGLNFPFAAADPTTFRSVGVDLTAKGDKKKVSIEKAKIKVDNTFFDFNLVVNNFDHPRLGYTLDVDHLDIDRYLAAGGKKSDEQQNSIQTGQQLKDYGLWREITLDGAIRVKTLIVGGGIINDIDGHLHGVDGIFEIDPATFVLNEGHVQTTVTMDFQSEIPQTIIDIKAQGVQAKQFLHDFFAKDFLSGTVDTDIRFLFSGENFNAIEKSLYADGTLVCKNGVLEGIDMVSVKKNIEVAPVGSDQSLPKRRTEFSELKSSFTIRNGLVDSRETVLKSPFASILLSGTADLVSKKLDLKVESKSVVVVTKKQEEGAESSEGSIPFGLSGSFDKPKINIDAQYLSPGEVELPKQLNMQTLVDKKHPAPVHSDVKSLVGETLINPAVVAQRFGLQPLVISKTQEKKHLKLGSGKMRVHPLQQKDSLH